MPKLFDDVFDKKLKRLSSNIDETNAFLLNRPTELVLPDFVVQHGYRLLQSKRRLTQEGHERTICLIADTPEHKETVYKVNVLVRLEQNAYLTIANATQLLVWRTITPRHESALVGFAAKVFSYLLQTHNIMVTDQDQTPDGRRFWQKRIIEAISMDNRHVYYIDLEELTDTRVPIIHEIINDDSFYDQYEPVAWGRENNHCERVFIISCRPLSI